ncbi:rRNA pseudouridine synthase [Candidatus Kuenenbacteria bacterium]|nr:rRNA pseudouridine synthase [Candidatus Kuenenbacteria bacterium]
MDKVRINKFLADCGVASRRGAERFILQGRVKVNGEVVTEMGTKVDPIKDKVTVNNKEISIKNEEPIVLMLNKPTGYVCTTRSFRDEKSVLDLIRTDDRIYPVGRLDKNSSGLLLLTNDGDLALKLTHPRYEKEKEYEVEVQEAVEKDFLETMRTGVSLEDGITLPAQVKKLTDKTFSIILKQGKKRQIRRMCGELGYRVRNLRRVRVNNLELGDLPIGKYKELSEKEIELLK